MSIIATDILVTTMDVQDAMRELRRHLGTSQESLARQLNLTLRTISRYETVKAPTGKALTKFYELAVSVGRNDLAQVFREAALESVLGSHYRQPLNAEEMYLQQAFERCVFEHPSSRAAKKIKELLKPYVNKIHEEDAAASKE